MARHRREVHWNKLVIKCPQCPTIKTSNKSFEKHIAQYHTEVVCDKCDLKLSSKVELQHHKDTKHHKPQTVKPGKQWPCTICENIYQTSSAMNKHKKKCHTNKLDDKVKEVADNEEDEAENDIELDLNLMYDS